ncbi:AlpA family phage regulatory protein [Luteimonas sp. FCS-9]|uniref:helix-turn-helix transcriptional regulator n=1 Tax=Luteimonas sp. FCS-9 TaxID=1547516 RepID=UPI00063E8BD5|nr:AlpA family phage regulatory protein [Luteimonas sp. FCS-9]KLJ02999.1 AlpA family transcriptional regulator [Luteimonas sp. FCS-9]
MGAAERLEELRTIDDVQRMTGMGSSWIYEQIKSGAFPAPIKIGRRSLWVLSEVDAWIKRQIHAARA